ncbi:MAG: hypothetical protein R3A80_07070 [Bdellovibrionota bacterium]
MNKVQLILFTLFLVTTSTRAAFADADKLTRFECEYTTNKKVTVEVNGRRKRVYEKSKFIFFVQKLEDDSKSSIWAEDSSYEAFWPKKDDYMVSMLAENLSESVEKSEIIAAGDGDGFASNKLELSRYPETSTDWEGYLTYESNDPDEQGVYEMWKTDVLCTTSESDTEKATTEVSEY